MKILEVLIGIFILLTLPLDILFVSGGEIMSFLSLSIASIIYFYLSVAIFNGIRLKKIFKQDSYNRIEKKRIIGSILTGLSLSLTITGIIFKLKFYPGSNIMLTIGISGLIISLIISLIKYRKKKSSYYVKNMWRTLFYCILGLTFILISGKAIFETKYRNHPDYIEAVKKSMVDPENRSLWEKVEIERQRMMKEK